ncbi:hypothetical protein [Pedobacter sp.]|uniref:hypothetical protein n=1 Tax=Pedobacter sp. TaxID=1411316 RepID=UPI003D7FD2FE
MLKSLLKSHQVIKWLVIIAACFLLVFGTVSLYMNIWVKPILAKRLKELVGQATENLYSIDFTGISVNCLTGDANLSNVKFMPNAAVLKKLIAAKKAPNNVYNIQLRKLSIRNVHPYRVYKYKKLDIDEVEILHPRITMVNKQYDFNENKPAGPIQSPYDYISKFLKEVRINTISFKEISFKYVDNNHAKPIINQLEHLNITLKDWLIDATSAQDTSRFYLLKEVKLQLSDYSYPTADSLYHVRASEINFTGSTGALHVKKLALVPRYTEMEFAKVVGVAKDRFHIQLSDVKFKGIDFPLLIKNQEFFTQEMNIRDGQFAVFNNNEMPSLEVDKTGQYPQQLLQKLPGKVTIKKLQLKNINICYAEYDADSKQKGRITFENTTGTVTNISNAEREIKHNRMMEANLSTYLMGQGKLNTQFKFDLLAADGAFSYSGELFGLNGSVLNNVTKPLGRVHIKSGMVKKLTFKVKANDRKAVGNMEFRYNDLAIAVLKKEKGKPWFSRQGLLSFLANNLIIKPDNPDRNGLFTIAKIDYERKPTRSFFSFVWKALFKGIRFSVGVTPQKEAMVKAHIEKFEKMKVEREKRREARERRKENR